MEKIGWTNRVRNEALYKFKERNILHTTRKESYLDWSDVA
jgi:hypothetical protein